MQPVDQVLEANFDGLVGPTHNYAGLSLGNIASFRNRQRRSNPRNAALECLEKAWLVAEMGIPQFMIPPLKRPCIKVLRNWGFEGNHKAAILEKAWNCDPRLVSIAYSASSMWVANAATITPSIDARDGKVHITPANLLSNPHRAIESMDTTDLLTRVFQDPNKFSHHPPLAGGVFFSDEGAANHIRLSESYSKAGLHLRVYGRDVSNSSSKDFVRYPARQTNAASQAIARAHGIYPSQAIFLQQSAYAIDNGVFHNDVIATGNLAFLFLHEKAYENQAESLAKVCEGFKEITGNSGLKALEVKETELSLPEVVESYLFNSQILSPPGTEKMLMICPAECQENARVGDYLQNLIKDPSIPVGNVVFVNLRDSMMNGGGPACLRLRAVLTTEELASIPNAFRLTKDLYETLKRFVERNYRSQLAFKDLRDPCLLAEAETAFGELEAIFKLDGFYSGRC